MLYVHANDRIRIIIRDLSGSADDERRLRGRAANAADSTIVRIQPFRAERLTATSSYALLFATYPVTPTLISH